MDAYNPDQRRAAADWEWRPRASLEPIMLCECDDHHLANLQGYLQREIDKMKEGIEDGESYAQGHGFHGFSGLESRMELFETTLTHARVEADTRQRILRGEDVEIAPSPSEIHMASSGPRPPSKDRDRDIIPF
ncbi:hypothetical protein ACEUZ9_004680 [Paracoccus litorisediminis]|uniref:hypothetical protein n=1 Tax=Paracoccus litorisediminis TaxID=2006130 RepID=UPI0037311F59